MLLWEEGIEFFHGAHHSPIVDLNFRNHYLLYSILANASMKPRNNITAAKFFKDQKF